MQHITQSEINNAVHRALNNFNEWNKVTGFVVPETGYYYELQSIIEDAVNIGVQKAFGYHTELESEKITRENQDSQGE